MSWSDGLTCSHSDLLSGLCRRMHVDSSMAWRHCTPARTAEKTSRRPSGRTLPGEEGSGGAHTSACQPDTSGSGSALTGVFL